MSWLRGSQYTRVLYLEGLYIGEWKCPLWSRICVRAQFTAQFMSLGQHKRQGQGMKIIPWVSKYLYGDQKMHDLYRDPQNLSWNYSST